MASFYALHIRDALLSIGHFDHCCRDCGSRSKDFGCWVDGGLSATPTTSTTRSTV
jgi:hypothetical protein